MADLAPLPSPADALHRGCQARRCVRRTALRSVPRHGAFLHLLPLYHPLTSLGAIVQAAQNAVPHYTTPTAPEFAIPPPRALPAPGAFAFPPVDERAEHVHDLLFNWQFYDREEGRDSASSSDEDDIKSKDATKVLARVHCSDDTTTDDDDDARGRTVSRTRVRAPRRREFSRSLARPNRLLLCAGAGPSDESSDEECFDCGLGAPPTTRRPSVAVASATQMSSPVAEKDVTERLKRLARALVGVRGDRE